MERERYTLEERVAYLEENIRALNKATTTAAKYWKEFLKANEQDEKRAASMIHVFDEIMMGVCPFPPEC